jgi:hypothetical protein
MADKYIFISQKMFICVIFGCKYFTYAKQAPDWEKSSSGSAEEFAGK